MAETFVGRALRDFAAAVPEESKRNRLFAQKRIEDELKRTVTLESLRLRQESGKRAQEKFDRETEVFNFEQSEKRRKLLLPDLSFKGRKDRALAQRFATDPDFAQQVTDAEAAKALGVPKEVGQTAAAGVGDVRRELTSRNRQFTSAVDAFQDPAPIDTAAIVAGQRELIQPSQVGAFERSLRASEISPREPSSAESDLSLEFDQMLKLGQIKNPDGSDIPRSTLDSLRAKFIENPARFKRKAEEMAK